MLIKSGESKTWMSKKKPGTEKIKPRKQKCMGLYHSFHFSRMPLL